MSLTIPSFSLEHFVFWGVAIYAALSLFGYVFAVSVCFYWRLGTRRSGKSAGDYSPGVTIFKPIAGVDEELEENIVSFFELDYEPLQLIFCSEDPNDAGIQIVRRVAARFPQRDALILSQQGSNAASAKMANLEAMLPHTKHEFVLLSDSNVRIGPTDLKRIVRPMQDARIGLVYQPVTGIGEETLSALIENLRLTELGGMLTVGIKTFAGQDAVMGKGMLCRRTALTAAGDFVKVRDTAADDHLLGMAIKDAGWKIYLSDVSAFVVHKRWPLKACYKRHRRHSALRWRICWPAYPLEVGFSPIICAIPALFFMGVWGPIVFLAVVIAKTIAEYIGCRLMRGTFPPITQCYAVVIKDFMMYGVWWHALFDNKVTWRGITYRMTWGTKLVRATDS